MINLSTIKIFDNIYELKYERNKSQYDFINSNFSNSVQDYIAFVKENKDYFIKPNLLITESSTGTGTTANTLPELNDTGLTEYYEYKKKQFIENENVTINYDFSNISEILNIKNTKAIKLLLDYLIDCGILKLNGEYANKNILGSYEFNFENLSVNNHYKNVNDSNSNNYTTIENQTVVNISGSHTKFTKNDFSNKNQKLEKEGIVDKILSFFKQIFIKK
jgi:hypothetical protein